MNLVLATNNKNKVREMKAILSPYFDNIYSLSELNIVHETIEDGSTFEENAYKKAYEICCIANMPALADDSGICAESLNGAPGIYSARYSGEHGNDDSNKKKLIKELSKFDNKNVYYYCSVCIVFPDNKSITAHGTMHGVVVDTPRGSNGFGYDPIVFLPEYNCTVAELDPDVKNKISHRYKALTNLCEKLNNK